MTHTRYFTNPSARSSTIRKRKRGVDDEDQQDQPPSSDHAVISSSHHPSIAALPVDLARQYAVSGQPYDADLPRAPFPHKSITSKNDRSKALTFDQVRTGLAALTSPLRYHHSTEGQSSLRQHHLAVLSTAMHKCLLDRDYVRAGRALGLLLQTDSRGHAPNVRAHGIWGIGVDVLLRRNNSIARHGKDYPSTRYSTDGNMEAPEEPMMDVFSSEGFELARRLYERLILEFPFQTWTQSNLTSLHFYPAMFGLWIAYVQDQLKAALASDEAPVEYEEIQGSHEDRDGGVRGSKLEAHRLALSRANDVATRLEELSLTFPHSDDPVFWRLKGMVALWTRDLTIDTLSEPTRSILWQRRDQLGDDFSNDVGPVAMFQEMPVSVTATLREQLTQSETAFTKAKYLDERFESV